MRRNILLMTATIVPPAGVPNLSRTDPDQRIRDYAKALEWYLGRDRLFDRVVFAENSLAEAPVLREIADRMAPGRVEFASFQGLDHPPEFDRAYGEFKLLDWAMSNSSAILDAKDEAIIWKVTGRYIVGNIEEIVRAAPARFDFYGNYRNWPKRWIDTYLLAWTREGYESLVRDVYHRLKTNVPGIPLGISGEELFRSWLDQPLFHHSRIVKRFSSTPDLRGIRGADGRDYGSDDGWKTRIRGVVRRLAPFIWI